MRLKRDGLWGNPDFLKLWTGQTVSVFGSLITHTALPFTAILVLDATPIQIALLSAAHIVPALAIGFAAGVWVDRLRRRPVMIAADIGRAVLLATIPVAHLLDSLTIEQLYVVALLESVLTLFFDVAYLSYLPSLVRRDELLEGNAKLAASSSVSEVGAFGVSGWLVQIFTGPIAVLIDAFSFVFSAVCVGLIRKPEPEPAPPEERGGMMREAREGIRAVLGHRLLRPMAVAGVVVDFSFSMFGAAYMLFVTRELGFRPGVLGMIFAVGGVSSLLGALVARRAAGRLGAGPAMVGGVAFMGISMLFVPLAQGATVLAAALLVAQQVAGDGSYTVSEVNGVSLRQAVTEDRLLGRVNAGLRVAGLWAMLVGALAGGVLGETVGLRATLVTAACGMLLAAGLLAVSPVRGVQASPAAPEAG